LHGHVVWRVKVATPDEMTCVECGETAMPSRDAKGNAYHYCPRCAMDDVDGEEQPGAEDPPLAATKLMRTLSYLREGEYE
jgi:uncharacterized paraquat-inducible protein A